MIETFYGTFPSQGYVQATMQPEELAPVQLEIDNIQKDFNSASINDLGHASNLQNEFYLKDCVKHLENLIGPLCQQYCKHSAYGDQSKINYTLKDAWVNYQSKHEYFGTHTHNGEFSFALWIKVPYTMEQEKAHVNYTGRNIQRLPAFNFHYTDAMGTIRNQILPVDKSFEGKLVLFPGNMNHSVTPFYTSDEYRITVSGNII